MKDIDYMRTAALLAEKGRGQTSPNPMVGALIVKNQLIVAQGWHQRCGGPHAEAIALKKAGRKSKGARLFVTLEPCFHTGHTPPCVDSIIEKGIKEVIVGMKDPNPLTNGKSIRKLKRAGLRVKVGVLQKELEVLNEAFIKYTKTQMPFVVAKTAQTLDGKIATAAGHSRWITSSQARTLSHTLRRDFDAILVGKNTVIKDNPRLNAPAGKRIKKVILDSRLAVSLNANLFKGAHKGQVIIATTSLADKRKMEALKRKGVEILLSPRSGRWVNLTWLMKQLGRRGMSHVLIEGGSQVVGRALYHRLVDKMHIYIAPKIMGDSRALNSITGMKAANINKVVKLARTQMRPIGDNFLVEGYVIYR